MSGKQEMEGHDVLESLKAPAFCGYCHVDISEKVRIRCAECSPVFELCGDCFSSAVELHPHKNSHAYRVMDCLQKPLFTKEWTIQEELKLLDGIDTFGLGNWKLISEQIVSKNARACDEHYWGHYMGKFGRCLPTNVFVNGDIDSGRSTSSLLSSSVGRLAPDLVRDQYLNIEETDNSDAQRNLEQLLLDRQTELVNLPPPEMTATLCSTVGSTVERFKSMGRDNASSGGSTKGTEAKKEQEIRDKIAQMPGADLAGYMPIRKDFDIEHDNDAEHLLTDVEFLPDDYPAETAMKLCVVRAYNNRLAERNIRKSFAIERGLVDIKRQQISDRRRCKEDRNLLGHLKVFQRFQTEENFVALCEGVAVVRRLKKQIEAYKQYRRMGIRTLDQARAFEVDRKKREHQVKATRSKQGGGMNPNDSTYHFSASQSELAASVGGNERGPENMNIQNARVLVKNAPKSVLLTDAEIDLCAQTGMLPLHYLAVQEAIVREIFRNGSLTMSGLRRVVKIQHEELLDATTTRSSKGACANGAHKKRKACYDIHQAGISVDAASKLFDFFVENVAYCCDKVGIPSLVRDPAVMGMEFATDSDNASSSTSRQSKRSRNTM